jgi:hypothetical protein
VQFFFHHQGRAFAVVSTFSNPDHELLQSSHQTLYVCKYQGDQALEVIEVNTICSVVAMVPFDQLPETNTISQIGQRYFMVEKFGLDMDHSREYQEENDVD